MGRMILELDWDRAVNPDRWERARNDKDFYTITYEGTDNFGNPKYNVANEKNGKNYAVYYSPEFQFCTCSDFIFRAKQDLVPCKHLYIARWWLEANDLRPEQLEVQKTYRVQPSEAFFRIQALKEQLQREPKESDRGAQISKPRKCSRKKSAGATVQSGNPKHEIKKQREWRF